MPDDVWAAYERLRGRQAGVPSLPTGWTADKLLGAKLPFVPAVVNELLPVGYTVLAGAPKAGKSWLLYQLCTSVALGEWFFGQDTKRGSVLYLVYRTRIPGH